MEAHTITAYVACAASVVVAFVTVLREMRERRRQDKDDHPPQ